MSHPRVHLDDPRYQLTGEQQAALAASASRISSLKGGDLLPQTIWVVGDVGYPPLPHPDLELLSIGANISTMMASHPIWWLARPLRQLWDGERLDTPADRSVYLARRYAIMTSLGLLDPFEGGFLAAPVRAELNILEEAADLEEFSLWLVGKVDSSNLSSLSFGTPYIRNESWIAEVVDLASSWLSRTEPPEDFTAPLPQQKA